MTEKELRKTLIRIARLPIAPENIVDGIIEELREAGYKSPEEVNKLLEGIHISIKLLELGKKLYPNTIEHLSELVIKGEPMTPP